MPKDASELRMRIEHSKLIYCASRRKNLSRVVLFGRSEAMREQCRYLGRFRTRLCSCESHDAPSNLEENQDPILISDIIHVCGRELQKPPEY